MERIRTLCEKSGDKRLLGVVSSRGDEKLCMHMHASERGGSRCSSDVSCCRHTAMGSPGNGCRLIKFSGTPSAGSLPSSLTSSCKAPLVNTLLLPLHLLIRQVPSGCQCEGAWEPR